MVSIPLSPLSTEIGDLLSPIHGCYDLVYAYDRSDGAEPWKRYQADMPEFLNTLHHLDERSGFWVRVHGEATWTMTGSINISPTIPLRAGWNLVGYPSLTARSPTEALASVEGLYDLIYAYDPSDADSSWRVYNSELPLLSTLRELAPGHGYWINVKEDCLWVVL